MAHNIEQDLIKKGLLKTISYADSKSYNLLRDSYFGTGGFLTGSYLQKSRAEEELDYTNRKIISNYRNIMKPVIDGLNDPIFSHDVNREIEGDGAVFEAFTNDADTSGESLTSVIEDIDLKAEILGCVFCFMDNVENIHTLETDTLEARAFPYMYFVEPDEITSYAFNNLGSLIFVKFQKGNNDGGLSVFQTYYINNGVWLTYESDGAGNFSEEFEAPAPFIYNTVKKYKKNLLPLSSHMDTATSARMIFNINSLINKQQFSNTFNLLMMKGVKADMKLGIDRTIFVPKETDYPEYLSPDTSSMDTLSKDRDNIQEDVNKVNNLTSQNSNIAQSGDSKRRDDKKRQEKLSSKMKNIRSLESWVVESFNFFSEANFTATVTYNESFDFFTISEDIEDIILMVEAGFTIETINKARSLFVGKFYNQLNEDEIETLRNLEEENEPVVVEPKVNIADNIND